MSQTSRAAPCARACARAAPPAAAPPPLAAPAPAGQTLLKGRSSVPPHADRRSSQSVRASERRMKLAQPPLLPGSDGQFSGPRANSRLQLHTRACEGGETQATFIAAGGMHVLHTPEDTETACTCAPVARRLTISYGVERLCLVLLIFQHIKPLAHLHNTTTALGAAHRPTASSLSKRQEKRISISGGSNNPGTEQTSQTACYTCARSQHGSHEPARLQAQGQAQG